MDKTKEGTTKMNSTSPQRAPNLSDFARALVAERAGRGTKNAKQASHLGISLADYNAIEAGELVPTAQVFNRLCAWCHKLRFYEGVVREARRVEAERAAQPKPAPRMPAPVVQLDERPRPLASPRPAPIVEQPGGKLAVVPAEAPPASRVESKLPAAMPRTLPEAIGWSREQESMTEAECAALVGVSTSAWVKWETPGSTPPSEDNYNNVCRLFPAIGLLDRPKLRKTPSRTRGPLGKRDPEPAAQMEESEPAPAPAPVAPPVAPSADRLGDIADWSRALVTYQASPAEVRTAVRTLIEKFSALGLSEAELLRVLADG